MKSLEQTGKPITEKGDLILSSQRSMIHLNVNLRERCLKNDFGRLLWAKLRLVNGPSSVSFGDLRGLSAGIRSLVKSRQSGAVSRDLGRNLVLPLRVTNEAQISASSGRVAPFWSSQIGATHRT